MDSRSTIFTVAAVTIAVGITAYAVYFDYKRRNDVEFRKELKKDRKRVEKSVARKDSQAASLDVTPAALREALQVIKNEEDPKSVEEKEAYFMTQVGLGEQLATQGSSYYLPSAMAFYRALRIYPNPVDLLGIYQKTINEPVFKLIVEMTNLDVKARIEGYYDTFPPKRMNVSIVDRESINGQGARKVLIVNKDFAAGEVIYKEFPFVAALDQDLQEKGTHCGQCLRAIQPEMSLQLPKDSSSSTFHLTYCSKACMISSKNQTHTLLFSSDPPLPPEVPFAPSPPDIREARRSAQIKFVEFLKRENRASPLLLARFVARQVAGELQKMVEATTPGTKRNGPIENDFTDSDGANHGYGIGDHMERLRYLEITPNKEEVALLSNILQTALPGLEGFVLEERHAILSGKMTYNAFGVCYGGGRDDKPESKCRPENVEKTRTPYGTQRQIGSAVYTVSSYLSHSCEPSARPSFVSGTSEMSIIASRDLKKGDELTIAFVDVNQHPSETVIDCRRRRRVELARGWRFACGCERCMEEGRSMTSEEEKAGLSEEQQKDRSRVEDVVNKYSGDNKSRDV